MATRMSQAGALVNQLLNEQSQLATANEPSQMQYPQIQPIFTQQIQPQPYNTYTHPTLQPQPQYNNAKHIYQSNKAGIVNKIINTINLQHQKILEGVTLSQDNISKFDYQCRKIERICNDINYIEERIRGIWGNMEKQFDEKLSTINDKINQIRNNEIWIKIIKEQQNNNVNLAYFIYNYLDGENNNLKDTFLKIMGSSRYDLSEYKLNDPIKLNQLYKSANAELETLNKSSIPSIINGTLANPLTTNDLLPNPSITKTLTQLKELYTSSKDKKLEEEKLNNKLTNQLPINQLYAPSNTFPEDSTKKNENIIENKIENEKKESTNEFIDNTIITIDKKSEDKLKIKLESNINNIELNVKKSLKNKRNNQLKHETELKCDNNKSNEYIATYIIDDNNIHELKESKLNQKEIIIANTSNEIDLNKKEKIETEKNDTIKKQPKKLIENIKAPSASANNNANTQKKNKKQQKIQSKRSNKYKKNNNNYNKKNITVKNKKNKHKHNKKPKIKIKSKKSKIKTKINIKHKPPDTNKPSNPFVGDPSGPFWVEQLQKYEYEEEYYVHYEHDHSIKEFFNHVELLDEIYYNEIHDKF